MSRSARWPTAWEAAQIPPPRGWLRRAGASARIHLALAVMALRGTSNG